MDGTPYVVCITHHNFYSVHIVPVNNEYIEDVMCYSCSKVPKVDRNTLDELPNMQVIMFCFTQHPVDVSK